MRIFIGILLAIRKKTETRNVHANHRASRTKHYPPMKKSLKRLASWVHGSTWCLP